MSIYLISDTHFNHKNIIDYCNRPFESLEEMESTLIKNWNEVVSHSDTVLFGGDLAMCNPSKAVMYSKKLNGNLVVLSGNHDNFSKWKSPFTVLESEYFEYNYYGDKYEFYYTHWPPNYSERTDRDDSRKQPKYSSPPKWFDGWVIHGHTHNNDLKNFPFVNNKKKTINVGCEVLNYTPIEMNDLIEIIKKDKWYDTIKKVPDEIYNK